MPWKNPRGYSFNAKSIFRNAPGESGVYAVFREGLWIYIGESDDIRRSLQGHLDGDNRCIAKHWVTGFSFELWPANERLKRQDELIAELSPPCNHIFG